MNQLGSEGQLKKRIDDLDWWGGYVRDDIDKIIDEAKKEFPFYPLDVEKLSWIAEHPTAPSSKTARWFMKWFGDSSE